MNVLILAGSPHKQGTTNYLVQEFVSKINMNKNTIEIIDTTKLEVHPCIGCYQCRRNNECVFKDDMQALYDKVIKADLIVVASPIYYFGITAQLKLVIDRFFAINPKLRQLKKKLVLISASGRADNWALDAVSLQFESICKYLNWEYMSPILANGFQTKEEVMKSKFALESSKLGLELTN